MIISYPAIMALSGLLAGALLVIMSLEKLKVAIAGVVGLIFFMLQPLVKSVKDYWLALFIFAIPLAAPKILGDREVVLAVMGKLGVPTGAIPAMQLFFSDIILFFLFFYWVKDMVAGRGEKSFVFPRIAYYAVGFILWSAFSMVRTANISYSFFELIRLIKFFALYLLIVNTIKSRKQIKLIIILFAVGFLIQGAVCVFQYRYQIAVSLTGFSYNTTILEDKPPPMTTDFGHGESKLRGAGTVGAHNNQAMYFELLAPLLLSMGIYYFYKAPWISLCYLSALVAGGAGLYVTFSRGGALGACIGVAALIILLAKRRLFSRFLIISILVVGTVGSLYYYNKIHSFLTMREGAFTARFKMNRVGMRMIKERPFLGFGLNASVINLEDYDYENATIGYPVHNQYIIIASETGIIGLVLYLLFYGHTLIRALSIDWRREPFLAFAALGMFAGITGTAVHMGWDHFGNEVIQTILWLFAALIVAMGDIAARRNSEFLAMPASPGHGKATLT